MLNLGRIARIDGDFHVDFSREPFSSNIKYINATELTEVTGNFRVIGLPALLFINMPRLQSIGSTKSFRPLDFTLRDLPEFWMMNTPDPYTCLTPSSDEATVGSSHIEIRRTGVNQFNFLSVSDDVRPDGNYPIWGNLTIVDNVNLTRIEPPNWNGHFEHISISDNGQRPFMMAVVMKELMVVGNLRIQRATDIEFPRLVSVTGSLNISDNDSPWLKLPELQRIGDTLYLVDNLDLENLDLDALKTVGPFESATSGTTQAQDVGRVVIRCNPGLRYLSSLQNVQRVSKSTFLYGDFIE